MTPRIGRIPYLNTEPFFADDGIRTHSLAAPPRQMIALAIARNVDIAPLPVVAQFDYPGLFRPVSNFGIACHGPARSVILRSRVPPDRLGGCRIGIIDETSTSVRLLKVLLTYQYALDEPARFGDIGEDQHAILLIGDRALRERRPTEEHPFVIDLAHEWKRTTGLPFVFALWCALPEVTNSGLGWASRYFDRNLDSNLADPTSIWSRRRELRMSAAEVAAYVRHFEYRLTDSAHEGLSHFGELDRRLQESENAA